MTYEALETTATKYGLDKAVKLIELAMKYEMYLDDPRNESEPIYGQETMRDWMKYFSKIDLR